MIKGLINTYYDIQHIRIENENQLRSYSQGVADIEDIWVREHVLKRLQDIEKDTVKEVKRWLKDEPLYTEWLLGVKGMGPILSAGLLAWIGDIERFATISKLWAYCGLHTVENPEGGDRIAARRTAGQKSNWNSKLKTHLWKIGESFVKTKGGYREIYNLSREMYDKKWETFDQCHGRGCKKSGKCLKKHRYEAAKRRTVKIFLSHYWQESRRLKGLPLSDPWIIGRDGHSHVIEIVRK